MKLGEKDAEYTSGIKMLWPDDWEKTCR